MEVAIEAITLPDGRKGYRSVPDGYLYLVRDDTSASEVIAQEKARAYGLALMGINPVLRKEPLSGEVRRRSRGSRVKKPTKGS